MVRHRTPARGFTLVEIIIVIAIIGTLAVTVGYYLVIALVLMGNFWVTQDGALACAQFVAPSVMRVVRIERHIRAPSLVTAEDAAGQRMTFTLDSDVFFNADCTLAGGTTGGAAR